MPSDMSIPKLIDMHMVPTRAEHKVIAAIGDSPVPINELSIRLDMPLRKLKATVDALAGSKVLVLHEISTGYQKASMVRLTPHGIFLRDAYATADAITRGERPNFLRGGYANSSETQRTEGLQNTMAFRL